MINIDTEIYKHKNHILLKELNSLNDNWRLLPNRAIFQERIERGFDDKNLLSVTIDKGVIPQEELIESTSKKDSSNEDKSNYKLVKVNDIAYNKMRMWQGAVGYSDYEGIVSPAYVILKPIADINSKYYHYLFRTNLYNTYSYSYSYGISNDTLSLRWDEFKRMLSIVPPRSEQDAIVKFLDEKISDIDKYISSKQKLIELLNELKAAIINKAVTKGIDPNVKMKDSRFDWLGEIPESWEIKKLKSFSSLKARIGFHGLNSSHFINEGAYCITGTDFFEGRINFDNCYHVSDYWYKMDQNIQIKNGDILVTKDGTIGKVAIVDNLDNKATLNSGVFVLRQKTNFLSVEYFYWLLNSIIFKKQIEFLERGTTIKHLYERDFKNFVFVIPELKQQREIIKHISNRVTAIDNAINLISALLNKISEYKNSLIAEAVTGKIKLTANNYEIRKPKNPYFARTVLAAEIINELYKEPTFGRVKLVKLLFLSERLAKLELGTNYHRQAAGPYDNQAIRSIEKQLKEHQWFETIKRDKGKAYKPLEKKNEYRSWFNKYYRNEENIIHSIINTFRTAKTIQCEIVATLYSAWEDLLKENSNVTNDEIVNEVLNNWHESKKRIPKERWMKALIWMKTKKITP